MMSVDLQQVGLYQLHFELGRGGYGIVYLARHVETGQTYAVKVMLPEVVEKPGFTERMFEEAHLLRAMPPHPNIVHLVDFGLDRGQMYLVMEYLTGADVYYELRTKDEGVFPIYRALFVAADVAQAIGHACRYGVIHCDIKPENIRILHDEAVKVMDFGIARAMGPQVRPLAGTPHYVAPEIWKNAPPSVEGDIYALGCTLYQMLLGEPPFRLPSAAGDRRLADLHIGAAPDLSPLQDTAAPRQLIELLAAMLAKKPDERPSPAAVVATLQSAAREVEPTARLHRLDIHHRRDPLPDVGEGTRENHEPELGLLGDLTVLAEPVERRNLPPSGNPPAPVRTPTPPGTTPLATPTSAPQFPTALSALGHSCKEWQSPVDLGSRASAGLLEQNNNLFVGALSGQVWQSNLRTSQSSCWAALPSEAVGPRPWSLFAHGDRVYCQPGGQMLFELHATSGHVLQQHPVPEPGATLLHLGDTIYAYGKNSVYSAAVRECKWSPGVKVEGIVLGPPILHHGAFLVPTSRGITRIDFRRGRSELVEQSASVCSLATLHGHLVAMSVGRGRDGVQTCSLRLWNSSALPYQALAVAEIAGQPVGGLLLERGRVFLGLSDGRVGAWDATTGGDGWQLQHAWEKPANAGRPAQRPPYFGAAAQLLALAAGHDKDTVLLGINCATGATSFEVALPGDVAALAWTGLQISVVLERGTVMFFRVSRRGSLAGS